MKAKSKSNDEMRAEYDFDYSKGVRGKYYKRLIKEGSNVVVLDPDVAQRFRTSAAVNDALRKLLNQSQSKLRPAARATERRRARNVAD